MKSTAHSSQEIAELRQAIFAAKEKRRVALGRASIIDKLRMLEEMRDFTASLRTVREANKAQVRSAWTRP